MPRLDDYISTLLAVDRDLSASELCRQIDIRGEGFVTFVIDHGLGPLWHERTGRKEFKSSRITSEALFIVQHKALQQIDERLNDYGIEYALFKGAANRLLIYNEPSIRPAMTWICWCDRQTACRRLARFQTWDSFLSPIVRRSATSSCFPEAMSILICIGACYAAGGYVGTRCRE